MKKILTACLFFTSAAAHPADAFDNSFYMHLGLGERQYPTYSINQQFDTSASGGTKPTIADIWAFNGEMALGYQSPALIGIEMGLQLGQGLGSLLGTSSSYGSRDYGDFSAKISGAGSPPRDYTENVSLFTVYVMPALRIPMEGLAGRPSFHTLGLQIASSQLYGSVTTYSTYTSTSYYWPYTTYTYTNTYQSPIRAYATTYTFCYRIEQMLSRHFSLGLDLSYHMANYAITDTQGNAILRLDSTAADKKPVVLDLSGPSIKLSLGIWFLRPFVNKADDKRVADSKARRIKQRTARRRGRYQPVDVSGEMAQRLLAKADAQMDLKNHAVAVELYREAVATDPTSRWAWQGLGNAQYYLKKYDEALDAYDRAYELSDGDEKLGSQIEKIRAWKNRLPEPGR